MGKRYYCEYCNKTMVSTPSIVRTHNNGLFHQKLVREHYQQFKDPETILSDEKNKKPCTKFQRGECMFGSICRFSHYTREELNEMEAYVAAKNNQVNNFQLSFEDIYQKLTNERSVKSKEDDGKTVLCDNNGVTHVLPWTYNTALDNFDNLPPSIKRLKMEDFTDFEITQWG